MSTNVQIAIDELAELVANKMPVEVLSFSPSEEVAARVEGLVFKEKTEGLTKEEKEELDTYMILEQIIRSIKAKAKS